MSLLSSIRTARISGSNRDELSLDCPFCEKRGKTKDVNQHLYINTKSNKFICHRCGITGDNIYTKIPELRYYQDEIGRGEYNFSKFFKPIESNYFDLDEVSEPIEKFDSVFNYLMLRGIPVSYIDYFNIRKGKDKYVNRVIVPNYEMGSDKCNYFTARSIEKNPSRKYLNPPSPRSNLLLNYSNATQFDTCILVEGWFTGVSYGKNFCCYMSERLNNTQSQKCSIFKNLYFCPDGGVPYKTIISNIKTLLYYRDNIYLIPVKRGEGYKKFDAEDFSEEERLHSYKNSKRISRKDILTIREEDLDKFYDSVFPIKR